MSLFILGIERSATTWVSSILEAHPNTEVFMEPMSGYTTRFTEWPARFESINNHEQMCTYFQHEMEILRARKRWLLTNISDRSTAWNLDLTIAEFLIRKKLATNHIIDFYELNFHRKNSIGWYPKSSDRMDVIKSLRLNFNTPIIQNLHSEAKVIVSVRDLASTIFSIHRQFARGNLTELKTLIEDNYGDTNLVNLFKYWQQSFNSLLTGLDDSGTPYLVCKHPSMLENLEESIGKIFDFAELGISDSVYNFLEESNRNGMGLHNTNRDHSTLVNQAETMHNKLPNGLKNRIQKENFHPVLLDLVEYE